MRNTAKYVLATALVLGAALPAAAQSQYTLKFGYGEPPDPNKSLEHVAATAFKAAVERESKGAITVILYGGGTLGDSEAMLQQVRLGSIQGCPTADAKLATMFAPVQLISIPYLFESREQAYKFLDGPLGQKIAEGVREVSGLKIISAGENGGFRSFSNNQREVRTPADMKGLKFRVIQSPILIEMTKNLGASPMPIAFSEMYTAIQTNVIQGQENPPAVVRAWKLDEIQPYYTLDKHTYSASFFVLNDKWYQALPTNLREAVTKAGQETQTVHRQTSTKWDQESISELRGRGMKVYEPTPAEFAQFRDLTQKAAIVWMRGNVEPKWIDDTLAAVGQK
jgi:tripartite ATP-independent transporter DctP family solute receptor